MWLSAAERSQLPASRTGFGQKKADGMQEISLSLSLSLSHTHTHTHTLQPRTVCWLTKIFLKSQLLCFHMEPHRGTIHVSEPLARQAKAGPQLRSHVVLCCFPYLLLRVLPQETPCTESPSQVLFPENLIEDRGASWMLTMFFFFFFSFSSFIEI